MNMKTKRPSPGVLATSVFLVFTGLLAAPSMTLAQTGDVIHTVVTATAKSNESTDVPQQSVTVRLDGKPQQVSGWIPLRGPQGGLDLVLLLDDSSGSSLALHLNEMKGFLSGLAPNIRVAVGYMRNGSTNLVQGFTADRNAAMNALHMPISMAGADSSPYFCLSDLIKHWPATGSRREVVMVTDGIDPYSGQNPAAVDDAGRHFDPQDPYVQSAIEDAQKAGIIVYSIYFAGEGRVDRGTGAAEVGQNYLGLVSDGTGGELYHLGFGNPVTFTPFLSDIQRKLENQYELSFVGQSKKGMQPIAVKTSQPNIKLAVQTKVLAGGAMSEK